jgi:hypothetical protein
MGKIFSIRLTFAKAVGATIVVLSVPCALVTLDMAGFLRSMSVVHGIQTDSRLGYAGVLLMAVAPALGVIGAWVLGARCRRPVLRAVLVLGSLMCGVVLYCLGHLMLRAGFPYVAR